MAQFSVDNPASEHLKLKSCFGRGRYHLLSSTKVSFSQKITIDVNHRAGDRVCPEGVIQALMIHTGLAKLSLLEVRIENA